MAGGVFAAAGSSREPRRARPRWHCRRGCARAAAPTSRSRPRQRRVRFRKRLPIPRELTGSDLTIPIVERRIQLLPGAQDQAVDLRRARSPGRRSAGLRARATRVTFAHQLPASAGELSVHLHGGHQASDDDGQPGGLTSLQRSSFYCDISPGLSARESGSDLLIAPGASRTYTYPGVEDGGPERGSFQWYHDHRLDNTARNVWRGLAGMWIIDEPAVEGPLNLPTGGRDIPLMITDRAFNGNNQLKNPFTHPDNAPVRPGDGPSHPGQRRDPPVHAAVQARRYRLRLMNTSNFRAYNVSFDNGLEMVQIATEAGPDAAGAQAREDPDRPRRAGRDRRRLRAGARPAPAAPQQPPARRGGQEAGLAAVRRGPHGVPRGRPPRWRTTRPPSAR